MRISFAANHGDIGGGEVMLLAMARAARALGRDVEVVTPGGALAEAAMADDFRTVTIHAGSTPSYLANLRRWARQSRPELLWCNGLKPAFATSLLPNRVVHLHSLPVGPMGALAAIAVRRATAVVVPSQWMNSQLGGHLRVLPNWTESLALEPLPPPATPADRPIRLGFLGRLTSEKGARVLARVVASLNASDPGRYQVIVGGASRFTSESDADDTAAALAALDPPTEFLGWVDRGEFFSKVDLAVFPSVFPESFGLVAAEAMAAGIPFVISDAGALAEVTDHDPRFIAKAGDANSLAAAIRAAATAYPAEQISRSRARWEEEFSPRAGTERFGALLDSLEAR
ncbi:glycosyltransferase family 4 protein [Tessaracoccus sp. MC1627]|uniref:glycosyltransferase family 4 protein n=1 Tax=Tessaracoccus sp. MC1627 TaxID=2760312 RepID=UPI00160154A9|nr:glycosyltransferase family 4 protein [Tessaracoccus sp. MC1627]MBB1513187.1 glycosyltransferase family 4 protein [Tessaracoccus sp. MC1627]MBB1513480.1 glycosyltransferase family 4 protein [Tessaracoccus sp. MC1627]